MHGKAFEKNDEKLTKINYLWFGKPHRLKSDERKEERKRGTQYERKSLKSRKEERIGTEKFEERKRGTKWERKSLTSAAFALCHRTGRGK